MAIKEEILSNSNNAAPNSDFYELVETMPAEELAIVKQVRTFMETKIALIILSTGSKTLYQSKSWPRSKNSTLAASPCRVVAAVADGLTEPTKETSNKFDLEEARTRLYGQQHSH